MLSQLILQWCNIDDPFAGFVKRKAPLLPAMLAEKARGEIAKNCPTKKSRWRAVERLLLAVSLILVRFQLIIIIIIHIILVAFSTQL